MGKQVHELVCIILKQVLHFYVAWVINDHVFLISSVYDIPMTIHVHLVRCTFRFLNVKAHESHVHID